MAKNDTTDDSSNDLPQVQGDPTPNKKLNWLEEVKADAEFNYRRREREAAEKEAYEASKAAGKPNPGVASQ